MIMVKQGVVSAALLLISLWPALLMAELYRLPKVSDRIRLLSRVSYLDFAALIAETDKRELPLKADGGAFLSSIAFDKQNSAIRQSARRTFLAR